MRQFRKFLLGIISLVCFGPSFVIAQEPAFYKEVQALKQKDSVAFPTPQSILFIGSSSFTKWTNVQEDFPNHNIVNRAFGGSSLPDLIHYADKIIYPYNPKQVVIYCGDNDLASSDSITPQIVLDRFVQLFSIIRTNLPEAHILYVSIKPSPSRARIMPKMVETNALIKQFLKQHQQTSFADIYSKMLLKDGTPNPSLFVEDNLHMNEQGYRIWRKTLRRYLKK